MTLNSLITTNDLKQADAIVLNKKLLGMVDHYAIFLGYRNNSPVFVANYKNGVKEVSITDMREVLQTLQPTAIDRFNGTEFERKQAVSRALSRIGERAYNYFSNNCEHFKNWVHSGKNRSEQVRKAGNTALVASAGTAIYAIANKSPKAGFFALGLLLAGVFLKDVAEEK
jgi:hypothetical protein